MAPQRGAGPRYHRGTHDHQKGHNEGATVWLTPHYREGADLAGPPGMKRGGPDSWISWLRRSAPAHLMRLFQSWRDFLAFAHQTIKQPVAKQIKRSKHRSLSQGGSRSDP